MEVVVMVEEEVIQVPRINAKPLIPCNFEARYIKRTLTWPLET